MKAKADEIGVTGFIQRVHREDVKLGFEGSEGQCTTFLYWLIMLQSDYHMIEWIEPKVDGQRPSARISQTLRTTPDLWREGVPSSRVLILRKAWGRCQKIIVGSSVLVA